MLIIKLSCFRYGDSCSRNHRRVCLSNVILVPGFYSHFSLEKNSAEYDTDVGLEFESSETRDHFHEFYKDVVPELESFGRIKTLKYCRNTEIHLRGNLYVEFYTERDAARALRKLKGRWYAGRQLNCEFANIQSWRSAVCGMSKCPKGRACNFLHTFKNPNDEYDIKSPPRWSKLSNNQDSSSRRSEYRNRPKWEESVRGEGDDRRNWRWSESPEPDTEHRSKDSDKNRRQSNDRNHHRRFRRESKHNDRREESDRSHSRSSKNVEATDGRYRSSSSRSRKRVSDNTRNGGDSSEEENYESSKRRDVKFRKRKRERNGEDYDSSKISNRRKSSRGTSDSYRHEKDSKKYFRNRTGNTSEKRDNSSHRSSKSYDYENDQSKSKDKFVDKPKIEEKIKKTEETERSEKTEKIERNDRQRRAKTKWDSEQVETSGSSDSCNSDSPTASPQRKRQRDSDDQIGNAWATTETEPDDNDLSDNGF